MAAATSRLDGPEKSRRSSKGHIHDNSGSSTAVNNGVTNNGVYGDDGDLIPSQHAPGVGRVPSSLQEATVAACRSGTATSVTAPVHNVPHCPTPQADSATTTTTAARWPPHTNKPRWQNLGMGIGGFNLGLGSPGLGMPNGLNMAQLAQLNGITGINTGMNPFNMNMFGMANLSAMGISPKAQLLAPQIAAAGGGFGQANLAV
jgi:hypothetical protein